MPIRAKTRYCTVQHSVLDPWSKVHDPWYLVQGPWYFRFFTIADFEPKVFERNYVIAIICFFDTCNQKTILQLRDGKFLLKHCRWAQCDMCPMGATTSPWDHRKRFVLR